LAIAPAVRPFGFRGAVVEALLATNLVAAVLAVGAGNLRRAALVVLVVALAAPSAAAWLDQPALSTASLAAWSALALLAAASALSFALRGASVGGEQIYAALSAYLLAGFFLGQLYFVIEQLSPGSLAVGGAPASGGISVTTAIYFSFVTLASLGYGDVVPLSDPVRGLAVAETVSGQLYLAVMVARLVGAWR
jgi:hypothetical protein